MIKEIEERNDDGLAPKVIEKLFLHQDAIARHLTAPMLSERQACLGKLLASGQEMGTEASGR